MAKWLIVGAGLTGATLAERIANVRGEEVRVLESRPYVGGAASDYVTDEGLHVQRFGPHVFHTNSQKVWDYIRQFSDWRSFRYQLSASVHGALVPLPVGFKGIDLLFPDKAAAVKVALADRYEVGEKVPIHKLLKEPDALLREVACVIYDSVFHGYTLKHWGVTADALDPAVLARVPIIIGDQDSYTGDVVQAVPADGYTRMVERMLDHPKIKVELQQKFTPGYSNLGYNVVYSGAIDEYFDYVYGMLPYRSVKFELRVVDAPQVLPVATVTYPNSMPYTRATDMKQITQQVHNKSAVVYEYPGPCRKGMEPLYPVPTVQGKQLYADYARRAGVSTTTFCGRLGAYRYYNMDQAVAAALWIFGGLQ